MQNSSESASETRDAGDDVITTNSADPIRRGTFSLAIESAQQQSSTCLTQTAESRAWQCMFDTDLQLNILPSPADDLNKTLITLGLASDENGTIHCGHQAPETMPTELVTVIDSENITSYHFQTTYNRTVFLKGDQLGIDAGAKEDGQLHHTSFKPGDLIWRCTFEETQLEGYISVDLMSTRPSPETTTPRNLTTPELARMPYSLKLVEQVMSDDHPAYCEKVEVTSTGELLTRSEKSLLKLAGSTSSSSNGKAQIAQPEKPS